MPSTAMKLEQRVTVLERELRKVRAELKTVRKVSRQPWWTRLAGSFKNETLFDKIIEAGDAHRRSLTRRVLIMVILDTDHQLRYRLSCPHFGGAASRAKGVAKAVDRLHRVMREGKNGRITKKIKPER